MQLISWCSTTSFTTILGGLFHLAHFTLLRQIPHFLLRHIHRMVKVGINGFGRIGRGVLRSCLMKNVQVSSPPPNLVDPSITTALYRRNAMLLLPRRWSPSMIPSSPPITWHTCSNTTRCTEDIKGMLASWVLVWWSMVKFW